MIVSSHVDTSLRQLKKLVGKNNQIIAVGEVEPLLRDEVFDITTTKQKFYQFKGHYVSLTETSKVAIRDNMVCAGCKKKAEYFVVFRGNNSRKDTASILFFHKNKSRVTLHTKDHIIPKSDGGPDIMSNYQNMCFTCNNKKGSNSDVDDREIIGLNGELDVITNVDYYMRQEVEDGGCVTALYKKKQIKLSRGQAVDISRGRVVTDGGLAIMDEKKYESYRRFTAAHNAIIDSMQKNKTVQVPWYLRILGMEKYIQKVVDQLCDAIINDSSVSRDKAKVAKDILESRKPQ